MKRILLNLTMLLLVGCATVKPHTQPIPQGFYLKYSLDTHDATGSWDQETLKAHDKGCPSAIFVAPGGDLVQCD